MTYRRIYLRRYGRGTVPTPVLAGVAAGIALAIAGGNAATHHHHAPAPAITWAGQRYTPQTWATAFLSSASLPGTRCNGAAVVAWIAAEGSRPRWHNPLDSTMPEPGSKPVNPVGVQSYTSWRQGLAATAATIRNGLYPGVLAAFEAAGGAQAVADAVSASPWGTQPFTAEC
jgi:hypothetical protein